MKEKLSIFRNSIVAKAMILSLAMLFAFVDIFAQNQQTVKGKITDSKGESVPGASIVVVGTKKGVVSDLDGNYSIAVRKGSELEFSYIGMKTQKIRYDGSAVLNVTMQDDVTRLDEAVVVGYGTQQRGSITNAVSTVNGKELLKAPTIGVANVVGTRVAGVTALQQSGQPGDDAASLLVRGQSAVYIVDGIQRDFNEIDPNEIESVSVLKDATSAAIYGLNSSAAIIVTTKKGSMSKPTISYSGEFGISQNANMLKLLDGPDYAYWYNKTLELDASASGTTYTPIFTANHVQYMKEGTNGWGNTNWYKKTFGTGRTSHHNVSATGGNENLKFFASIGAFNQEGNVDHFSYNRYNLRSNIDAKIAKNLIFSLGISGRIEKRSQPGYSANPDDWNNVAQQAVRALPYVPEYYAIDGVEYPISTRTNSSWVNPIAGASESGYNRRRNSYIQTNLSLQYNAPFLHGLFFKFTGAYDLSYQNVKTLSTPYNTAIIVLPTAGIDALSYTLGKDPRGTTISSTESSYRGQNITSQTSANYENIFGKHKVKAIILAETREAKSHTFGATGYGLNFINLDEFNFITNTSGDGSEKIPVISGSSNHTRMAGFVGRVNYEFDDKYLVEASVRYDGSYLFGSKSGTRWVTLPGISAGWKVNNEKWFNVDWVNSLKIRASVGMTANTTGLAAYQYMNLMTLGTNQVVLGGSSSSIVYSSALGNPSLAWAKCLNYNVGFDFTLWKGLLGGEFDFFYKYEYDILSSITGSYSPSRGGYYYSYGNENEKDYRGFDITLKHNNHIGDFEYGAKLVLSYAKRRWLKYAGDAENTPDYQKLTGKDVGSQYGFIAQGLFQNQEEINNSATIPGSNVAPGYIKYLDRNGDGKITYAQDMGYVGKSAYAKLQGSLSLFANWKGFDIDMLWQWATGRTVALTGIYSATGSVGVMDNTFLTKSFYHGGNSPTFLLEHSWTPENTGGEFPRPSIVPLSSNNAYSSSFWYRNGNYLRLKTIQIGYTFPKKWLQQIGIELVRVYVEGSNLLTFSGLTKYNIDPEQPGVNNGYYPQQRTYSLGVKLTF